jgi:hypothetical protein
MAINCSSNALLDTLNAKKEALNAKVADLSALGAGAMADLQAKADEMKDALLAAVPEPPVIPNFKKELEEIKGKIGKELAEAKAAFEERWGDALPDIDIDGLMEKVSEPEFDFCKDVPNIEAPKVSAEGKVEQVKVKAEEPIVAADIPKKVEVVEPTVIEKEKEPSVSPKVDTSAADIKKAKDLRSRELNEYRLTYKDLQTEATKKAFRILSQGAKDHDAVRTAMDSTWQSIDSIVGRMKSKALLEGVSDIEYYNSGKGKRLERSLLKKYIIAKSEEAKFKEYNGQMMRFNHVITYFPGQSFAEEAQQQTEYMNKKITLVKEEGDSLVIITPGGHDAVLKGYAEIATRHQDAINDLRNYKV